MDFEFKDDQESVNLTLICGIDSFGREALKIVKDQISVLPQALQAATHIIDRQITESSQAADAISDGRRSLTLIDNINHIESELGWEVSKRANQTTVQHIIVGKLSTMLEMKGLAALVAADHRFDAFTGVTYSEDYNTQRQSLDSGSFSSWSQVLVTTSTNRRGEEVSLAAVQSSIAGMLLVSMLQGSLDSNRSRTTFSTFGFAGLYGMTGPALNKLAEHAAYKLIDSHLSSAESTEGQRLVSKLVERHNPQKLARSLFESEEQPLVSMDETPIPSGNIPAIPSWENSKLFVSLDRGELGIDLTPPGKEDVWVKQIREHVRAFDMTLSYAWRRQLEGKASRIAENLEEHLVETVEGLLNDLPHSPGQVAKAIQNIEEKANANYAPVEDPTSDLEDAFDKLRNAIVKRPSAPVLSVRLAVWVIPALVAGASIISGLYVGPRSILFPALFAAVGVASAVGWTIWRVQKSRNQIKEARDRALEMVVRRQEAILSENAIGCLRDPVLVSLRKALQSAKSRVDKYVDALQAAKHDLSDITKEELATPITFEPVLSLPEEYDQALDQSMIDASEWLKQAVDDRVLEAEKSGDDLLQDVVKWCTERIEAQTANHAALTFAELWEIRQRVKEDSSIQKAFSALWKLAAPLVSSEYAPESTSELRLIVVPDELDPSHVDGLMRNIDSEATRKSETIPLLCCFRAGALKS